MKSKTLLKELNRLAKTNDVRDDEFTVKDYIKEFAKNGIEMTSDAARAKLNRMAIMRQLNKRKVLIDSSMTSVYSFKKQPSQSLSNPRLDE